MDEEGVLLEVADMIVPLVMVFEINITLHVILGLVL